MVRPSVDEMYNDLSAIHCDIQFWAYAISNYFFYSSTCKDKKKFFRLFRERLRFVFLPEISHKNIRMHTIFFLQFTGRPLVTILATTAFKQQSLWCISIGNIVEIDYKDYCLVDKKVTSGLPVSNIQSIKTV